MDKLKRSNENFFQDILSKEDKIIYPYDIDAQFNEIAQYLDGTLKPAVDALVSGAVEGVAGSINAFLHNVGDGTTDWQYVNSDKLDNYSISLDKLVIINPTSVLVTAGDGNLVESAPSSANQILFSRIDNIPTWQLVTSEQIEPKSLTGAQFGVLSMENFVENQFITNIVANVVTTENIQDLNVTNEKLTDGIITSDKLGIFANLPVAAANLLNVNNIADGAITADKVRDGTIPVSYNNYPGSMFESIWGNVYGQVTVEGGWVYKQLLKSENLKDNTIEDARFSQILYKPNDRPEQERVEAAKAFFPDVPLAFQFQADHIAADSLDIYSFDAEVQAAINRL
jgi:hypothetical protein